LTVAAAALLWSAIRHGRALVEDALVPPSLTQIAAAVADGLHEAGVLPVGHEHLDVGFDPSGEYRCHLTGVTEQASSAFATALHEVIAPIASPRYLLPRYVVTQRERSWRELARVGVGRGLAADGVVRHAAPAGVSRRAAADVYAVAWDRWVGGRGALFTGTPEGAAFSRRSAGATRSR
jgi:hypothetical protein